MFTFLNIFVGTYLQLISVFMQNYKFGGVKVLAEQLFNEGGEEDKEHEKTSFAVFPGCYVEIHLFLVNILFFECFRH